MADQSHTSGGGQAGRIAREVSAQQAALLRKLRNELGDGESFAVAAERLAEDFGAVAANAVDAVADGGGDAAANPDALAVDDRTRPKVRTHEVEEGEALHELPSLYAPGHMRRRLEQLVETNRRYKHPFALAIFDASGPGTRNGDVGGGRETVLAILGAALRDSIRIVDEAFRLEEDAICVLAPNLRTVEGVQMAERLLGLLDDLEKAGGLRIDVAAGVAACPEHGTDAEELLRKADAALWRARAVGQPVGVGALA
ncbi:MAG TPA: diguanylate cyclase [Solirubrobacterales bacterium]|nr:diguanylate cyclase [Solirubrobacterales bacterium]